MALIDSESSTTSQQLTRRLDEIRRKSGTEFIKALNAYNGDKDVFSQIIRDSLAHHSLPQNTIASLCLTTPATVSRWARGTSPSLLARIYAVHRISEFLTAKHDH